MEAADVNHTSLIDDMSWIINASQNVDPDVVARFRRNRDLDDPAFFAFIVLYSVLICFGATGNGLVVWAVARKPAMRTARNIFILNLAVSDLLLCLVTMPLTLMEVLTKYWPLGEEEIICKMTGSLQATSIFVSTMSITAIALDRYQVIVYPTSCNVPKLGAIGILVAIWLVAVVMSIPLFLSRKLNTHEVLDMGILYYCVEVWSPAEGRAYYSIASLVFQYVLPIITVTVAYSRICKKLRYRYINSSASRRNATPAAASATNSSTATNRPGPGVRAADAAEDPETGATAVPVGPTGGGGLEHPCKGQRARAREDRRMRRTNSLLISIALIFGVSWLPLNLFNLTMDLWGDLFGSNRQAMLVTYAACHMIGMSSACTNPMLYGWLNENFRKEFKEILAMGWELCCFFRRSPCSDGSRGGGGGAAEAGIASGRKHRRLVRFGCRESNGKKVQCQELTNGGPETCTSSMLHPDAETTSFTHVL